MTEEAVFEPPYQEHLLMEIEPTPPQTHPGYGLSCGCPYCWHRHLKILAVKGKVPKFQLGDLVSVNKAKKLARVNKMILHRAEDIPFLYVISGYSAFYREHELSLYQE